MKTLAISILLATSLLADNISTYVNTDSIVVVEGDRNVIRPLINSLGGYVIENPYLLPNHTLAYLTMRQIREVSPNASFIFPASPELITGSPVSGCLHSNVVAAVDPSTNKVVSVYGGQGWDGPGLGHASLTYTFGSTAANGTLSSGEVQTEVIGGLSQWSYYADIDFTAGSDPNANYDFNILWALGEHGLNDTFGAELAHSFYPPFSMTPTPTSSIYGNIHFNNIWPWGKTSSQFGNPYYDVWSVAGHEAGHGLGLMHSDDIFAWMYPYYDGRKQTLGISDIDSIRALYGYRNAAPLPQQGTRESRGGTTPFSLSFNISNPTTTTASSIMVSGVFSGGLTPYTFALWSSNQGGYHGTMALPIFSVEVPLVIGENIISFLALDANGSIASGAIVVNRNDRNR